MLHFYNAPMALTGAADLDISQFTLVPKLFGHQKDNPDAVCFDRILGDFELVYVIGG